MIKRILTGVAAAAFLAGGIVTSAGAARMPWSWERIPLFAQAGSGVMGSAYFTYNPHSRMSTVTVTVRHLKPNTMHPAHIHVGRCGSNGPVLIPLPTVRANAMGVGTVMAHFKGTFAHRMWYVNVHMGPGLSTASQFTPIACGNVV